MHQEVKPLFIFSLPRSGSTLLQRVLVGHKDIESFAEPWIFLPLVYPLKDHGVYAEYDHKQTYTAFKDFCDELPNGRDTYLKAVGDCALGLYRQASNQQSGYFLDKTPRYALICAEIMQAIPDARHVFLWRNPLAIIASLIETWGKGKWVIFYFQIDLFDGLANLISVYEQNRDHSVALRYEDFLADSENEMNRLCDYLELEAGSEMLKNFSDVSFKGIQGDPTGRQAYSSLRSEPLDKWKRVLNNPWRKAWCRRYLKWIGKDRLQVMGYDLDALLFELNAVPTSIQGFFMDLVYACGGVLYRALAPCIARMKWSR